MDPALTHLFEQYEDETALLPPQRIDRFACDGIGYSAPWPSFSQSLMEGSQSNQALDDSGIPCLSELNNQLPGTGASSYDRHLSGTVFPSSSPYAANLDRHGSYATQSGRIPMMEWDDVIGSESVTIQSKNLVPLAPSDLSETEPRCSQNLLQQSGTTTTSSYATNSLQPASGESHQKQPQLKEIVEATLETILKRYELKPLDLLERDIDSSENIDSSRTSLPSRSDITAQPARQGDKSSKTTKEQVLQLHAEHSEAALEKIVILYLKRGDH